MGGISTLLYSHGTGTRKERPEEHMALCGVAYSVLEPSRKEESLCLDAAEEGIGFGKRRAGGGLWGDGVK
jgi:hypothetical protein